MISTDKHPKPEGGIKESDTIWLLGRVMIQQLKLLGEVDLGILRHESCQNWKSYEITRFLCKISGQDDHLLGVIPFGSFWLDPYIVGDCGWSVVILTRHTQWCSSLMAFA